MRKIMRKILASMLVLALCIGSFSMISMQADATEPTAPEFLVAGASVRNNGGVIDGIRFKVAVEKTKWDSMSPAERNNICLLMLPTEFIPEGEELEVDNCDVAPLDLAINWTLVKEEVLEYADEQTATYMVARVYLNGIPLGEYATGITARMYYDDGENITYSAQCERSYVDVASAALEDVKAEPSEEYENAVGSQFSPYSAEMRDALIGVKYENKKGVWDLVDGKLTTIGATKTEENTTIQPFLLDRDQRIDASKGFFTIECSLYVPKKEAGFVKNGMVFAYDEKDGSYWMLDVRYNSDGRWFTNIRKYNSAGQELANHGVANADMYEEGNWYEYRIFVDKTDSTKISLVVDYKKVGATSYKNLITADNTAGATMTGTRVGFCTDVAQNGAVTLSYDATVNANYSTVLGGANGQTVKLNNMQLGADGTGTIKGQFVVDYRATKNRAASKEGILFSGNGTNGYMFYVASGAAATHEFYVGIMKVSKIGKNDGFTEVDGTKAGAVLTPAMATNAGYTLANGDQVVADFTITITKDATTGLKIFDISCTFTKDGKISAPVTHRTAETSSNTYTGQDVYLYSNDTITLGNGSVISDGKTIYNLDKFSVTP